MIANGHHFPDILDYTLAQLQGFLHAINRQDGAHDARLLSLIAVGSRGDAKNIDQTLDRLTEQSTARPSGLRPRS